MIAHVFIDGIDVCEHLVEQGMAWHYKPYDDSAALRDAEERARRAKRGLWKDREPVPPWEWRKLDKDERQRRREAAEATAEFGKEFLRSWNGRMKGRNPAKVLAELRAQHGVRPGDGESTGDGSTDGAE